MISDEESSDSDSGVRFKTTNVRDKYKSSKNYESQHSSHSKRNKYDLNHIKNRSNVKDNYDKSSKKYTTNKETDKSHTLDKYKKHTEYKNDYKTSKTKDLKVKNTLTPSLSEENRNPKRKSSDSISNLETCNKVTHLENNSTVTVNENIYFGPTLPPKKNTDDNMKCNKLDTENTSSSKVEPTTSNKEEPQLNDKNSTSEISATDCKVIGPLLPEHLRSTINELANNAAAISEEQQNESESDDDIIGPLPVEVCSNPELEERALQIKLDLLKKTSEETTSREEWMLELPPVNSVTQVVGKRKFRTKEMPDLSDRSMWTDTAKQKTNKKVSTDSNIKIEKSIKDSVQEKIVEKHRKNKRNKSLVDLHEEAQKIKMKSKPDINERRPFSRDIDLKTNHMNEAQTKAVIKKAQLLDNRFSSGQSKFL